MITEIKSEKVKDFALKAIVVASLAGIPNIAISSSVQSQMDEIFGDMTHTTQPGVFESQSRGVLTGGSFTTKSKIMDASLMHLELPSVKAGCAGLDMFGGSFSFINTDQIIQLLRTVAANAKGYAFQLAIEAVSASMGTNLENWQKKIQAMNSQLGNSCQLAQGIVNDSMDAMGLQSKHQTEASFLSIGKGIKDDWFEQTQNTDGNSSFDDLQNHSPEDLKELTGNIVWQQLIENDVKGWFPGGDDELLEIIMTISGTYILEVLEKNRDGEKKSPVAPRAVAGNSKILKDLIDGSDEVEILLCGSAEGCTGFGTSGTKKVKLEGFTTKLKDALLGADGKAGIVAKFRDPSAKFEPQEEALMSNLPSTTGFIIRQLSVSSPDSASDFVHNAAPVIALTMTYELISSFMHSARLSITNSKNAYKQAALDVLKESQTRLDSQYQVLKDDRGTLATLLEQYNSTIINVRRQKYLLEDMFTKAESKG